MFQQFFRHVLGWIVLRVTFHTHGFCLNEHGAIAFPRPRHGFAQLGDYIAQVGEALEGG